MFKKIIACVVLASMLMLAFAGCVASGDNSKGSDSSKAEQTAQEKYNLIKSGKLVMGTNAEFPPFEYPEGDGFAGIDIDIMTEIAKKLGVELVVENMPFDSLDTALDGKVDILAAGLSIKPDRAEQYNFTEDYFEANQTIIVKAGSAYQTKDDLKDKVIGGQSGNTGIIDCASSLTTEENIKGYNNGSLAVEALLADKIDAVIVDDYPAQEYKKIHGDNIVLIEKQFPIENYAMGINKSNKELLEKVNEILAEMKSDGSLQAIIDKYIN